MNKVIRVRVPNGYVYDIDIPDGADSASAVADVSGMQWSDASQAIKRVGFEPPQHEVLWSMKWVEVADDVALDDIAAMLDRAAHTPIGMLANAMHRNGNNASYMTMFGGRMAVFVLADDAMAVAVKILSEAGFFGDTKNYH